MSLPIDEQWRPVVQYEGYYEVSDQGRVRSVDRTITKATGHQCAYKGRVLMLSSDPADGRRRVVLSKGGRLVTYTVASLVLKAFAGEPPPGHEGCHNDGDATNNALSNLRWDTHSANNYDKVRHGTHHMAIRERCPRGHVLQAPNLVASAARRGGRTCLACSRAKANTQYAKRTGRPYDFVAWADEHYQRIMKE